MPATHTLPIEQLIRSFKDRSLPAAHFTHEAHLRTGLWYVYHHQDDEATCLLRAGIIIYNHSQGGVNDASNGYHETITLFWIAILSRFVRQFPADTAFEEIEQKFMNSPLADKNLPFLYFSRERLLSAAARSRWMEPDIQPI